MPFDVFVFADPRHIPSFLTNVNVRKVKRYYPDVPLEHYNGERHFENFFDVLHKIEAMVEEPEVSEHFILFYDDTHLIRDVNSINELFDLVAMQSYEDNAEGYESRKGKWLKTIMSAMTKLKEAGRPRHDYETHLPRFFTRSRWRELLGKFPPDKELIPYAPSTLYYNWFYDEPLIKLNRDENKIKAGFYGERPAVRGDPGTYSSKSSEAIKKALEGKKYVNYNDIGLTTELKQYLAELFPDKSRYERDDS
jgi:hypothetical protein